jgi:hypothetical protein
MYSDESRLPSRHAVVDEIDAEKEQAEEKEKEKEQRIRMDPIESL